jgi:5-methylcytosine-specific restriction endonuclease McrA
MVGPKNPAWKGGVADWDYAAGWKVIARKIRDRDLWTCQNCGEQRKRWGHSLHVHHIDGNKLNNDPANLVSLCATCHRAAHREEVI